MKNTGPRVIATNQPSIVDRIGRWFSRLGRKSRTLQYIVNVTSGGPTWSRHDIREFAQEGYAGNPYVYSALNTITQGMAEPPPVLYRIPSGGKVDKAFRSGYNLEMSTKGFTRKPWSRRQCATQFVNDLSSRITRTAGVSPPLARRMALKQLVVNDELEEVTSHPVLDLLARPNGWYQTNYKEFVEAFGLSMLTAGEVFTEPVGNRGDAKAPVELYILPADSIYAANPTRESPIPAWEWRGFRRFGGRIDKWAYDPDPMKTEMFFNKLYDPSNPLRGLSPMEAAVRSIDLNNEARGYNLAFMRNAGVPPALITGEFDETGAAAIEEAYEEQTGGGQKNAGRIVTLSGQNLQYHPLSMDAAKLMWGDVMQMSAKEVSIVWRVPPEILGDSSNKTFSNYREARSALYHEMILPSTDFMYASWNATWVQRFDDSVFLDYDTSQIIAIQEDLESAYKRLEEAKFLTINEKRGAVGWESIGAAGDVILVSLTQVPLEVLEGDDREDARKYLKELNSVLADMNVNGVD